MFLAEFEDVGSAEAQEVGKDFAGSGRVVPSCIVLVLGVSAPLLVDGLQQILAVANMAYSVYRKSQRTLLYLTVSPCKTSRGQFYLKKTYSCTNNVDGFRTKNRLPALSESARVSELRRIFYRRTKKEDR